MGAIASLASSFPFKNILAPPWMGVTPLVAGVSDIEWDLSAGPYNVPLGTTVLGTPTNNQQFQLDGDYDYIVRAIQIIIPQPGTGPINPPGNIRIRIRDGNGRMFTTDFVYAIDINGPLAIPWALRRGSVLTYDFQNVDVSNDVVDMQVVLIGHKRAPCPGQAELRSDYRPARRLYSPEAVELIKGGDVEDFEYPFSFTSTGQAAMLKVPLQTDNDADFIWRGIAGPINDVGDTQTGNVVLRFYDMNNTPLGSFPFLPPWLSQPVGGILRECILSDGYAPNPMATDIIIPRGGITSVDIYFANAQTVAFSLTGQKVYKEQACS
jgi:hypothetical protein